MRWGVGGQKGRKKSLLVWTVWCKNTYEPARPQRSAAPGVGTVLWHSTLSDMVGRPLSRVLCVIIGGVIIWAGRASGDRHLAQLHVAAT